MFLTWGFKTLSVITQQVLVTWKGEELHFYIPKLTFVTKNNFTYFSTEQKFLSLTKCIYSKSISRYNANFPVSKFSTQKYKCQ